MAAQEKPKVIPVDNFVRDELYPGYTQSGQVAPDYWAVDRASGRIGERRVGGKHMWTVFDLATAEAVPMPMPAKLARQPCLHDDEVRYLMFAATKHGGATRNRRAAARLPGRTAGPGTEDYIQIGEPLTPRTQPRTVTRKPGRSRRQGRRRRQRLHVHRAYLLWLVPPPVVRQTHLPLAFPALLDANVHGLSLEFGARKMAEIDLVGKWDRERILSAGLIDIKTHAFLSR